MCLKLLGHFHLRVGTGICTESLATKIQGVGATVRMAAVHAPHKPRLLRDSVPRNFAGSIYCSPFVLVPSRRRLGGKKRRLSGELG